MFLSFSVPLFFFCYIDVVYLPCVVLSALFWVVFSFMFVLMLFPLFVLFVSFLAGIFCLISVCSFAFLPSLWLLSTVRYFLFVSFAARSSSPPPFTIHIIQLDDSPVCLRRFVLCLLFLTSIHILLVSVACVSIVLSRFRILVCYFLRNVLYPCLL